MCKYGQQYPIMVPDFIDLRYNAPWRSKRTTVSIDYCLIPEIWHLWTQGVKTAGCCCGHKSEGKLPPEAAHIAVEKDSIQKMIELGYENIQPPNQAQRLDLFKPKTRNHE